MQPFPILFGLLLCLALLVGLYYLGDYVLAQTVVKQANYAQALVKQAKAKSDLGDQTGAIDDYSRAIALYPREPQNYVQRGRLHYALKNYQQAIADADQAIELIPDVYHLLVMGTARDAYSLRGNAREKIGDWQGAEADLREVDNLTPGWD